MSGHDQLPGSDLVVADHSRELESLRPRALDGCDACRACALWNLKPKLYVDLTGG